MRISDWSSDVCSSDLPAFDHLVVRKFDRAVEEELDLRTIIPVGEGVDRAVADGDFIARCPVERELRRLRQLVAVDREDARTAGALRVEYGARRRRTATRDEGIGVVDLGDITCTPARKGQPAARPRRPPASQTQAPGCDACEH